MDSENTENKEIKSAEEIPQQKPKKVEKGPSKISIWKQKLKEFWKECIRVLKVTRKPDKTEFRTIVKISGLGIAVIGFIGFLIFLIKELIL